MKPIVLPEIVVHGHRLGRHIYHDPRSLAYTLPEGAAVSVMWERYIPILDQGNLGSCTGNAAVGALGSGPLWNALVADHIDTKMLNEQEAIALYSAAEVIDGGTGYPPEDNGSYGLSVAKAAKDAGLISGYQHATSVDAAHTALAAGPFITGTYWYSSMDHPTAEGVVTVSGTVRGGHEYVCRQYDAERDLWWFDNSWGGQWGNQGRFAYDSDTFGLLLSKYGDVTSFVPVDVNPPQPGPTPPEYVNVAHKQENYLILEAWANRPFSARKPSAAWREDVVGPQ